MIPGTFSSSLCKLPPNLSDHIYWKMHSPRVAAISALVSGFETCDGGCMLSKCQVREGMDRLLWIFGSAHFLMGYISASCNRHTCQPVQVHCKSCSGQTHQPGTSFHLRSSPVHRRSLPLAEYLCPMSTSFPPCQCHLVC